MKSLLDIVLFVAWVAAYLTAISWIAHYRRARARALAPTGHGDYRADRDIGLWLAVLVLGVLSLFLVYFLSRVMG